jgi:CheY-like chemotaxis protein
MTKTILHVEDEENDVLLFKHALSKAGVENPVHVAHNGREAIEYFEGEGKFSNRDEFPLPHVILLDLKLPLVPGVEVLKWIRENGPPAVPVVVLTSSENEADIEAAYRLGANGYVVKPNEVGKLVDVAKAIKSFWLNLNSVPSDTLSRPPRTAARKAHAGRGAG